MLQEALGIVDPFGPEDTHAADARRGVTKDTEPSPKQAHPAGAGNIMAKEGGNTGKAPPAIADRRWCTRNGTGWGKCQEATGSCHHVRCSWFQWWRELGRQTGHV